MVNYPTRMQAATSPTDPTTSSDDVVGAGGLPLSVRRYPAIAEETRSPLVYAHGFGQTQAAWERSAQQLAFHGFAGLTYDARGHGSSGRNPADLAYQGEQFADDLINVVGECAQPPVLVGASMGGIFGMLAEARWPGLFHAMVLVDITPRWETAGMERILAFMSAFPEGFDSLEHAADVIAAYLPHRSTRKSPQELRGLLRQNEEGRWQWHWDPRLIDELARDSQQHQGAIAEAARQLQCPVLLISGGRSDLVSAQTVAEFQQLVPHARHIHRPKATHMVAGDENDSFTTHVMEYLAELQAIHALPESTQTESVPGVSP